MEHRHYLTPLFDPESVVLIQQHAVPAWANGIVGSLARAHCRTAVHQLGAPMPAPGFDLAVLVVAGPAVSDALAVAAALRCKAAVVMVERAAADETARWFASAQRAGIRLLGPGSMGFMRPGIALDASRMGPLPADGNVALVSQSGVLGGAILDWSAGTAIGFSLAVSLGAEVDVDIAQVLDFLASDPRTKSVVLYLEAVRQSRSFMSALRALAVVKPVVVLKGNRGDDARNRLTHSGAICASDAIYSAAFRRAGAVQLRLFTQLFTASRILASRTWPLGKRLAIVSNGNGPAVLAADIARFNRIPLPTFSDATDAALRDGLPGAVIDNPLDLGISASPADYAAAIAAVAADPACDGVMAMLATHDGVDAAGITDRLIVASRATRKPVFACWMGGESTMRPFLRALDDAAVPVFRTPESAVDAWATIATFQQNQLLRLQTPRPLSGLIAPDLDGARMIIDSALAEGREVLTGMESKALLGAFHIPVVRTVVARSPAEAVVLAEQTGFPIAMKIASVDVSHKTDVGGVVLDVRNAREVRAGYARIVESVRRVQPDARIDGVALQAMRGGVNSRELYVGMFRDPLFGPVIAFGAGGTRVEVVRDTTLEFPPLNRFLAQRMIERTRVAETLGAFRGAAPVDAARLEALLVSVSEMVCELPWISGMDINPLIADDEGVIAVDARIVLDASVGPAPARHAHMAIMPYPTHLTQVRTAPDGAYYTVRAIQPEDADRLQAFVRGLSAESRYYRFISALAELPPRMLVRYTQIDYDREMALVAVVSSDDDPDDERIIGVVRYLRNPDGDSCEFAVAVGDAWQGRRLGATLMRAIIDAARTKGFARIEGFVLATNGRMLGLMTHLGFRIVTDPEDPTMKLVTMSLN